MKFTMGNIVGTVAKVGIIGVGCATQCVGKCSEIMIKDEEKKEKFRNKTDKVVQNIKSSSSGISVKLSNTIDTVIVKSGEFSGSLSKNIAIALNASEKNIKEAERIGNIAGKMVVGGGIGLTACAGLVSGFAVSGTAGAASMTSGLAALGGGSIAAGGYGMAGGVMATSAITATSAMLAGNTKKDKK